MSTGQELAERIRVILADIQELGGARFYTYFPNISELSELANTLLDATGRVNAWFIIRSGLNVSRYGEGRRVPSQSRIKTHVFTVRGYISVYDNLTTSEVEFQNLCDKVEERLGVSMSLGVQFGTTIARSISMAIGYEMLGRILCHTCTISITVDEYLATSYEL